MLIQAAKTQFPMVYFPQLKLAMSLLPVTKMQFERYLFETSHRTFEASRYYEMLSEKSGNQRVSPRQVDGGNYYRAIATALRLNELAPLIEWMNEPADGIDIPTEAEWRAVFLASERIVFEPGEILEMTEKLPMKVRPRDRVLLMNLDHASRLHGFATTVMQLVDGTLDLVRRPREQLGEMGRAHPKLRADADFTGTASVAGSGKREVGVRWIKRL